MPFIKRHPFWPDPRVKPDFGTVELDRAHPLSRGLVGFWLLNERAGGLAFDLTKVTGPLVLESGMTWGGTVMGPSMTNPDSDPPQARTPGDVAYYPEFSVVCKFVWTVAAGQDVSILRKFTDSTGTLGDWILAGEFSQLRVVIPFGWDPVIAGATSLGVNVPYTAAVTRSGTTSNWNWRAYLDGVLDGDALGFTFNHDTDPSEFHILGPQGLGAMGWTRYYNRELTAAEVTWLHQEPFCGLRPLMRRRYFAPVGGATVRPAWYYQRRQAS